MTKNQCIRFGSLYFHYRFLLDAIRSHHANFIAASGPSRLTGSVVNFISRKLLTCTVFLTTTSILSSTRSAVAKTMLTLTSPHVFWRMVFPSSACRLSTTLDLWPFWTWHAFPSLSFSFHYTIFEQFPKQFLFYLTSFVLLHY